MASLNQRIAFSAGVLLGVLATSFAFGVDAAPPPMPATTEGLVKVPSKRLGAVYLLPGADFRSYTRLMIDPAQVSFRKGWVKDINSSRRISQRVSEQDAEEIAAAMRTGFQEIFATAFKAKGYEIVDAPATDVLRLTPEVVNVYLNAPDPMGGAGVRTYTVEAGEATLALTARDSTTGAVLGIAIDRSGTGGAGRATFTTNVSNRSEFEDLFRYWARVCVNGLEQLKSQSPIGQGSGKR